MTLSGVLKDILLVGASMTIFQDPVSGLQGFGYSIALGGLVYYKLGADKLKVNLENLRWRLSLLLMIFQEHMGGAQRAWADYGVKHPALRKLIVFGLVIVTIFILLGGISQSGLAPAGYDAKNLAGAASDRLGW